jgi:vancomycin resistance protein YoaR
MKAKTTSTYALSLALPAALLMFHMTDQPYSRVLASNTVSLAGLSSEQKLNVANAASRVNGVVIKPHDDFSFNGRVGPRTIHRGYLPAPSYVEKDSPDTIGGGICLLSSVIYHDALVCGFEIKSRVPHIRAIHSIPPGLDATVWYNLADLRFQNNLNGPVEIVTRYTPSDITVEVRGSSLWWNWQPATIQRDERHPNGTQILTTVRTTRYGKTTIISNDKYDIPGVNRNER